LSADWISLLADAGIATYQGGIQGALYPELEGYALETAITSHSIRNDKEKLNRVSISGIIDLIAFDLGLSSA